MFKKKKAYFFKVKNIKISVTSAISYILDWLIYGSFLILFSLFRVCLAPRYHEFALDDNRYSYTFYNDQFVMFANWVLLAMSLLAPVLYIIIQFSFLSKSSKVRKIWNIHCALLAFLAAQTIQVVIVSILKNALGVPRPDMIARCMPSSFNLAPIGSLSNVGICANPNIGVINDGFRSFPSGHASTSFCSSTSTFFIFATRNSIFEKRHPSYKIVFGLVPFMVSMFITATRYSDNRHSLMDLFFGAKIGIFAAYLGYHLYFPWYQGCGCNQGNAYPPRRLSFLKKDKFKFWKLPEDDYEYDSDAMDIEDDMAMQPYFYIDEESSIGSKSTRKNYPMKEKEEGSSGQQDEGYQDTQKYHRTHHHTHRSKSSRPQSKKECTSRPQTQTQTTTYTIKMKEPQE